MFLAEDADEYYGYVQMTYAIGGHKVGPPLLVELFCSSVKCSR